MVDTPARATYAKKVVTTGRIEFMGKVTTCLRSRVP